MRNLFSHFLNRNKGIEPVNKITNPPLVFPVATKVNFITSVKGCIEVRFVHATSSKFEKSIKENGLRQPRLNDIIDTTMAELHVPANLQPEINELIERDVFGINLRFQFTANPIYCSPLHQEYVEDVSRYARIYANGGEIETVCRRAIVRTLEDRRLPLRPQREYESKIVLIRFKADEIQSPLFEERFVSEFETCLASFNGKTETPPGLELRVQGDVSVSHIEDVISVEKYRDIAGT